MHRCETVRTSLPQPSGPVNTLTCFAELPKQIGNWRTLAVIKDLIYSPQASENGSTIVRALEVHPGYHPDPENISKHRHVQWGPSSSSELKYRDHFSTVSIVLQRFLNDGIDVNTRIPIRRPGFWDPNYYTLILHVAGSHWSTNELVDVVLREKDVDVNALDSDGYTALDCAYPRTA